MTIDLDALEHQLRSGEKFTNGTRIAGATTIRRLRAELKEASGLLTEALDDFISDEMEQAIRAFLARNGKGEGQ